MHELTTGIKHAALSPLAAPLVALSWFSVCLLVAGTGLIVLACRLSQIALQAALQIVRA